MGPGFIVIGIEKEVGIQGHLDTDGLGRVIRERGE